MSDDDEFVPPVSLRLPVAQFAAIAALVETAATAGDVRSVRITQIQPELPHFQGMLGIIIVGTRTETHLIGLDGASIATRASKA